jgi:hypothetical protein
LATATKFSAMRIGERGGSDRRPDGGSDPSPEMGTIDTRIFMGFVVYIHIHIYIYIYILSTDVFMDLLVHICMHERNTVQKKLQSYLNVSMNK